MDSKKCIYISGITFFLFLYMICCFPIHTSAQGTEMKKTQDYIYRYNEEYKGIEILSYLGKEINVKIPDTIDNIPVTVIGKGAFQGKSDDLENVFRKENRKIRKIILPETVELVKSYAFYGCIRLENINLPDNVRKIEKAAFDSCKKLQKIKLPENIQILEEDIFLGCRNLHDVKLPENLTEIPDGLFGSCSCLEKVVIPKK